MDASLQGDIIMLTRNVEIIELWKKNYLEGKQDTLHTYGGCVHIVEFLNYFLIEPELDDLVRRLSPLADFILAVNTYKPPQWSALRSQIIDLFKDDEKVFWDLVELLTHFGPDIAKECSVTQLQDGINSFCALMSAGITWPNYALIWQTLEKGFTWDANAHCLAYVENEKLFEIVNRYFQKSLALKGVKAD